MNKCSLELYNQIKTYYQEEINTHGKVVEKNLIAVLGNNIKKTHTLI